MNYGKMTPRTVSLRKLFAILGLLLSGCGAIVPAQAPAQLNQTPGPPVILTDERYESALFRAIYPQGWGAITSAAFSDPWVVFLAPEENALIVLALDPDDTEITPPNTETALRREEQAISLADDTQLTAVLVAPAEEWDAYRPLFTRVIESVV